MYSNTGYRHDFEKDLFEKYSPTSQIPLCILSCGVYRLLTKSQMTTCRPLGRQDYQLLYINKGKACFHFAGQEAVSLEAGHMVLYRPYEFQQYSYNLEDHPEVFWLHFSGDQAESVLEQTDLFSHSYIYTGCSRDFVSLFSEIIGELQQTQPYSDQILLTLFHQLIFTICRHLQTNRLPADAGSPEVEEAVAYFQLHYSQEISIQEYARNHNVSTCWFIRSFKQQMNMTPLQYITSLRIQKACELLETTSYPIQEISELIGYENPLYFSRIFKEKMGFPPKAYRNMM